MDLAGISKRLRAFWRRLWRRTWFRWTLVAVGVCLVLLVVLAAWLIRPFYALSAQFAEHAFTQPSRMYGQSTHLVAGNRVVPDQIAAELKDLGYFEADLGAEVTVGRFRVSPQGCTVFLRAFPTPRGPQPAERVDVMWDGKRIQALRVGGNMVNEVALEPPLLASFYGAETKERRPVELATLPDHLVRAVLAAEDDSFFEHGGLSTLGILRAAWVNVAAGGKVKQGGSTLTQQMVKNLYFTQERTWQRKAREAVLSILIDRNYDKREILEAYLNEIYWGQSGSVSLLGVGAVSRVLFAKDPQNLTLTESALLAGMIQSPGEYWPTRHPEKAMQRRNYILERLAELRWFPRADIDRAKQQPLGLAAAPVVVRRASYFVDAATVEVAKRFGITDLADHGFAIFTTLHGEDQRRAEESVAAGIEAAEKSYQKGQTGTLQSALVSLDPKTGSILAYVGGRDYRKSQFDRASQAQRQAGSAFKPVVYATAFQDGIATPATVIEDSPLTIELANMVWEPQNDDDEYRGWVSARTAIEDSLNVPTARLAMQVGLKRIVEVARGLGVTSPLQAVPALSLGAFEVSPIELATVYATLANGGVRPNVHGVEAVLAQGGSPLTVTPFPDPVAVLSPSTVYLVTSVLQGVLNHGTATSVRNSLQDPLAGKTGTTNGRRDSWFAGYAPTRATLVWVGYDDNSETRLSGARAAVPIWSKFMLAVRPPGGYENFSTPPGITTATIDPETGELATERCPKVMTEFFLVGHVPSELCHLHAGAFSQALQPAAEVRPGDLVEPTVDQKRSGGFRAWLHKVFGNKPHDSKPPNGPPPG
ncbi:MAG: PBP1A family penicillin-binding protein [Acidobacteriota bacterium]